LSLFSLLGPDEQEIKHTEDKDHWKQKSESACAALK
jgi:hypothetical protein